MSRRRVRGSNRTERDRQRVERPPATIPVDVVDRGEDFLVVFELPGFTVQDIDVQVDDDQLAVAAERPGPDETIDVRRKERPTGRLDRVVTLPERVDEKHVSATYVDGLLSVVLKKRR